MRPSRSERDLAFGEFMTQAQPSLGRTAYLLTGDVDTAHELVQAALVKTYLAWSRVQPGTALAYARRALVNHRIDGLRRGARVTTTPTYDAAAPPDDRVDDRDEVVRMLAALPEQQRKVVVLRYYADLTEQQVADALGVSVGTVKSTASRALATLRERHAADRSAR